MERVLAPATGGALALFLLAAGTAGCDVGVSPGDDDDTGGDVTPPGGDGGDGGEPPLDAPAKYVRGSLTPNFGLPSFTDQQRFLIPKVEVLSGDLPAALADNQFECAVGGFTPVQQKMFEVEQQISAERGEPTTIIPDADQDRALGMPWRSNATDVDCIDVGVDRSCIVPMGGQTSTPGNSVAIVTGTEVNEVFVGIRPVRTACSALGVCFVANQFSNYISVVDMVSQRVLENSKGVPVEIPVDYYTSDILLVETQPGGNADEDNYLYVANEWLGVVTRYDISILQGGLDAGVEDVVRTNPVDASLPISTPDFTVAGVGSNPQRLKLAEQQRQVYVADGRGGEVAVIDAAAAQVQGYTGVGAPSVDILEVQNNVFVSTTSPDRGLLAQDEQVPEDFQQQPEATTGINGSSVVAHEGALLDRTKAYNFEDMHNSIVALSPNLNERDVFQQTIFTDAASVEENFQADQKQITATLTGALETDGNGTLLVAGEGNDLIQQLDINGAANFPLTNIVGGEFTTTQRPTAMFVDKVRQELVVVTWGGGLLETFDLNAPGGPIEQVDLGYAVDDLNGVIDGAQYPCSDLEIGEFAYINTEWSSNGFKSCMFCHRDDLIADGGGWSNGVTAPTTYHKVIPCWNQSTTDNYFWTGTFTNDSYLSLAYSAQTRTNCELIAFALTEGPGKAAADRVGDPLVAQRIGQNQGNDAVCQPEPVDGTGLPANFVAIQAEINNQKLTADIFISDTIQALTNKNVVNVAGGARPLNRVELSRLIDWWMVSQNRVPPNPQAYLNAKKETTSKVQELITRGEAVFSSAGCVKCHDPLNARAPFTDNKTHGGGAGWTNDFIDEYINQPDKVDFAIAQEIIDANDNDRGSVSDRNDEINLHLPMDDFRPFAFDDEDVLLFEDPLPQVGNAVEEDRILTILDINMKDPERGYPPGYVEGQVAINTPSLRGVWWNPNYLHHSMAKTFREAVVGPGHEALRTDLFLMNGAHPDLGTEERGWAFNRNGSLEAHGATSGLNDADLTALEYYVYAIP